MHLEATEDFAVERIAFSWRARFRFWDRSIRVVDELDDGEGRLRDSLLRIPLQIPTGPEIPIGETMRYRGQITALEPNLRAVRAWPSPTQRMVESTRR